MTTCLLAVAQSVLTVFAAASLHAAFPELAARFEAVHPGVTVRFSINGSQILEAQLENGARADVFASADRRWMDRAIKAGVVSRGLRFASNQLVIVSTRRSNIVSAADLAGPRAKIVLCAAVVPCGSYARRALDDMSADPRFGSQYSKAVLRNVVSEEFDVESVLAKVTLGEADAGIVYRTDAIGQPALRAIALPASLPNPIAYYAGAVRSSSLPSVATSFIEFIRSPAGQEVLRRYGFTAP